MGVTVYAPGSTSNVGPGFDCFGIAITGLGDRVTATREASPGVRVLSVSDPAVPLASDRNTAALGAAAVLRRAGAADVGLGIVVEKGLPLAGGLGGSAASAVAGALAAHVVLGRPLSEEALLEAALEAEAVVAGRHPDNVTPSLVGGAVVIQGLDPVRYTRVNVHAEVRLVFVMPDYRVETATARSVLPSSVARGDAVGQAAALAGLVLGLERGDRATIGRCLVDRIAEPSRVPLYPGFAAARAAALEAGAMGVGVSGAGPTLLAVTAEAEAKGVARAAAASYRAAGLAVRTHVACVETEGARVLP